MACVREPRHKRSTRAAHAQHAAFSIPLTNAHAPASISIKRRTRRRQTGEEKNGPDSRRLYDTLVRLFWPLATGWIVVQEGKWKACEALRQFWPFQHGKTPIDRFPRNGDTPPVRRNEDEQPSVQTSNRRGDVS